MCEARGTVALPTFQSYCDVRRTCMHLEHLNSEITLVVLNFVSKSLRHVGELLWDH